MDEYQWWGRVWCHEDEEAPGPSSRAQLQGRGCQLFFGVRCALYHFRLARVVWWRMLFGGPHASCWSYRHSCRRTVNVDRRVCAELRFGPPQINRYHIFAAVHLAEHAFRGGHPRPRRSSQSRRTAWMTLGDDPHAQTIDCRRTSSREHTEPPRAARHRSHAGLTTPTRKRFSLHPDPFPGLLGSAMQWRGGPSRRGYPSPRLPPSVSV